jgi:8-oxo-dGTP pyrophosphatase MutT (NUDIX family)
VKLPVPVRRLGYRCAYAVLRVYWFVIRPEASGVKCVLTDGDRVLLVRHTYGHRGWDLPGGSVKRGEAPKAAARREMHEELGLCIEDLQPLGEFEVTVNRHLDHVNCFQSELSGAPITIDRGELDDARWFHRQALPTDLGRYARRILARALAASREGAR